MPLLLIPLTISSAFLLVSERTIAVYKLEDVLEGESKPRFRGEFPKDPKDPVTGTQDLPSLFCPLLTLLRPTSHSVGKAREDGEICLQT